MNQPEIWSIYYKKMSSIETYGSVFTKKVARGALLLLLLSFISSQAKVGFTVSPSKVPTPVTDQPVVEKSQLKAGRRLAMFSSDPDTPVQYLAALDSQSMTDAGERSSTAEILVPATYLDKLIDPAGPAEDELISQPYRKKQAGLLADLAHGQVGAEYRYFRTELGGDIDSNYQEHGLGITLRQDTVDYGRFELEAAVTNQDSSTTRESETGGKFRLLQSNFYLTNDLSMDNRLGHVRTRTTDLLSNSHHIRLPQPIIQGAQSRLNYNNLSISLAGGNLGTLEGRTFPAYDNEINPGTVAGIDAIYNISPDLKVALQGWNVQGALSGTSETDHTSITGAVDYQYRPLNLNTQLHFLTNDSGANGIWLDGAYRQDNGFAHKAGIFKLDTDLIWIDNSNQINGDRQGFFWEGNFSRSRLALHLGADYYQTNLGDDPAKTAHFYSGAFTNIFYRLFRDTTVGGGISYLGDNSETNNLAEKQSTYRLSGNIGQRTFAGTTSFRLRYSDSSGDLPQRTTYEGILDQEWSLLKPANLRTGISYYNQDRENEESLQQTSVRLFGSYPFQRVNVSGGISAGIAGSGETENGRSSSANLNLGWAISNAWQLRMDYTYSRFTTRLINNQEVLINEQTANLALRYNTNWGRRVHALGKKNGTHGNGRIIGTIFLDANRNGIQEPSEPGAPNVVVYLDGVYSTETDATGKYEFWPVTSGKHNITLDVSNVSLPWILEDESPKVFTVYTRSDVNISYGLIDPAGQ